MTSNGKKAGNYWVYLLLLLILALAWWMRSVAAEETRIAAPLRVDAKDYYSYAINLKHYGTYSNLVPTTSIGENVTPSPDADRMPGYPLFLSGAVTYPPTSAMIMAIKKRQVWLDTLTVALVFVVALAIMPAPMALLPTLLVAVSPHLISMSTYILSETLFAFSLTLAVLVGSWALRLPQTWLRWLAFGAALGLTFMVKSSMTYVPLVALPLLWLLLGDRQTSNKAAAATLIGFTLLIMPWEIRNQLNLADDASTQSEHAIVSLHNGTYPGLMFNDNPETQGYPHQYDPDYQSYNTFPAVLGKLWENTRAEPVKYISWYLLGKPRMMFSWGMISGQGDIFIYSADQSPYYTRDFFNNIHTILMRSHTVVMLIGLLMVPLCWLPRARVVLGNGPVSVLRLASIPLLYLVALHTITTPLPRYGVPLRPIVYLFFAAGLWFIYRILAGDSVKTPKLYAGWDPIGTILSKWRVRAVQQKLPPGEHLDIACGDNRLVSTLGRGYGIDITAFSGVDITVANFSSLPLADESLDSASILAALNYFEAPVKTLQELNRCLKPGGIVVITLLSKPVSHYWHKLRDRGLPRITYDDQELHDIVDQCDLQWHSKSHFMFGVNRLIVLKKSESP